MSQFLLDTDTLSLLQQGNPVVASRANSHPITDIAVSGITIQEQARGWQASISRAKNRQQLALAYDRLGKRLLPVWCHYSVLAFTEPAILRFEQLRSLRLNVGSMDLRIAAIALENTLTVVTRNASDFGRVPGLKIEDWSM